MTNEQPAVQRMLRRRADGRVIGGVASGLGDYFNVDPLLIRIIFVGLMVFGGMGILLYVTAWLLIPDDATNQSVVERLLGRGGPFGVIAAVVLAVVGLSVLFGVAADAGGDGPGWFVLALAVILVGAFMLRRNGPAPVSAGAAGATSAQPLSSPVAVPRRDPSPLGGYVIGTAIAAVGVLALVANATGAEVTLAHYFGLALGLVGIGLVVGTWWGHARGLILLGLLMLPFAIPASFVAVPLEGGFGEERYTPTAVDDLEDEYRLTGGELTLDLTDLMVDEPVTLAASVGIGELVVRVPEGAAVEVKASVGAGSMNILDVRQSGTTLTDEALVEGDGPQLSLDLEAGVGRIRVESVATEDR